VSERRAWKWTCHPSPDSKPAPRIDVALTRALELGEGEWEGEPAALSRNRLQRLIEEGHVRANDAVANSRTKLEPGTRVEVLLPPPRASTLVPEDRPLDILYQDMHLLVLNKPPGLTVHPSETQADGTLVHALLHHVRDLSGIGGELRPGIVHRIDKNTSGALLITKTDEAHLKMAAVFAKHDIERVYWALCYGSPGASSGTAASSGKIESLIGRNPNERKKMSMEVKEGRRAVTHYALARSFGVPRAKPFASLIEARLETGRTHQVRVHLTGLGHSLLGDPTYGTPTERQPKWLALPPVIRERVKALPGQALHARVLGFEHPITGQKLRFEAEPPAEFRALLDALAEFA
jgi:23S rRNA pseudouridine1911/1915/1917 synthase